MNDLSTHPWWIIGGAAIAVAFFKGYIKAPAGLAGMFGGSKPAGCVPAAPSAQSAPGQTETQALALALAAAAVRESHQVVAGKMAEDMRAKLLESLTAPFSAGAPAATPASPPPAQKL